MVQTLFSDMLFDVRTLQSDRNYANVPLAKNVKTRRFLVPALFDNEFAYWTYNLLYENPHGGEDFFGVFSDDGKIAARNLVKKMSNMIDKRGYTLLHELGNRFEYECIADGTGKEIDDKMVLYVSKNILLEEKEVSERRIGFRS